MKIAFTKMHGLGNDFIILNAMKEKINLNSSLIQQWSNRRTGIGFDQLLILEPSTQQHCEFYYRIFNADGNEVEQCGNGARCVAHYAFNTHITTKQAFDIETKTGDIHAIIKPNGLVTINMGSPRFEPKQIPFIVDTQNITYALQLKNTTVQCSALSMGNPHCIITVETVDTAPLQTIGVEISKSAYFPSGVNVGFMQIITPEHIKLRVLERGVGETDACGSGACAAVVAGRIQSKLNETVLVTLPGGELVIEWRGDDHPVLMTGPTATVFTGTIEY